MDATKPGGSLIGTRLSIMMFFQFFLWGAWYVALGPFMHAHGMSDGAIGNAYTVGPLAAILAPIFLGMIADRFFPSQVVLGAMHIIGGALLALAPKMVGAPGESSWPFVGILFAHMLCYMPTPGLSNTVAFHNVTNPEKQFPLIRVLGTIGWIVAGLAIGFTAASLHPYSKYLVGGLTLDAFETARAAIAAKQTVAADILANVTATVDATQAARSGEPVFFYIAGASGVLLGLYSFSLPNTPPPAKGKPFSLGSAFGFESLSMMKNRPFMIFVLASFLVCVPLAAYYGFAGRYAGEVKLEDVPIKMTYGQMSEIFFMLVMPMFFVRLGVKWMLAVGMLAWVIRYGLFAGAWGAGAGSDEAKWLVLGGIVLHGICYDFFFVTGQIYVDRKVSKEIRGQAQGFLVFVTQGLGLGLGAQLFPMLVGHYTTGTGPTATVAWDKVWLVPSLFALAVLVLFVLMFKERKLSDEPVKH